MKKIYLVLTMPKTGSTYLQNLLQNNTQEVEKQGFYYPVFDYTDCLKNHGFQKQANSANHMYFFNNLFLYNPSNVKLQEFTKNINFFLEILETKNNIIIVAEGIIPAFLPHLKNIIESHGFDIKVLVTVRKPYDYHCSFSSQQIKSGSKQDITVFESQIPRITKIHETFSKYIPIYLPYIYSKDHLSGSINNMMKIIGLKSQLFKPLDHELASCNLRLNNLSTRYKLQENKKNKTNVLKFIKDDKNPRFLLTQEELNIIMPKLKNDNQWMEKVLNKHFCDIEFPVVQ